MKRQNAREPVTRIEVFAAAELLEKRDRLVHATLLRLLVCAGFRLNEALGLTVADIDLERRCIRLRLGDRIRWLPVASRTIQDLVVHLDALTRRHGRELQPDDLVFPISRTTAAAVLRRALLEVGVPVERAFVYGIRKGAILDAVERGMPLSWVNDYFMHRRAA